MVNPAALQTLMADVNALLVCEFNPAIPLTLPPDQQVERVLYQPSIVQSNHRMAVLCRYGCSKEMHGCALGDILDHSYDSPQPLHHEAVRQQLLIACAAGYQREGMTSSWRLALSGEEHDLQVSYYGVVREGQLQRLVILQQDETARGRQERLVFDIAQQLAYQTGDSQQDFFARLVEQLARYLSVATVIVGELVDGCAPADSVRTLGYWHRERLQQESIYPLAGGPCAAVTGREVCSFPRDVAALFPQDLLLQEMGAQAYLGVPLHGEGGQQIGILCLLHDQPLHDDRLARSLLTIFSLRAAAELDRLRRSRARDMRAARRHVFFDTAPHGMHVTEVDPPMPANLSVPQQVRWLSEHGRYVECNAAYARMLERRHPDEVIGKSLAECHPDRYLVENLQVLIGHDFQLQDHPVKCIADDGGEYWLAFTISAVYTPAGLSRLLTVTSNITERMQYTRQIEHRARHDGLTGLPNRAFFYEVVEQHLAGRTAALAVFILDLDGFKEVNDTLGHEMGDQLLREIGPRLQQTATGQGMMVARLGGDEFAILLPEYRHFDAVQALADTVIAEIRRPFRVRELDLVIGASMGIALYPEQADSVSALMRCADIAMYQAKRNSRQVELYRRDLDHYTVRRLALMMDIRQAIGNDELHLVYQPIVELESREVLGFEALLRWQHPEHGLLLPSEFIPLIELTDMMEPLTWWVLENSTRALRSWQQRGWDFQLSVNISTRNICDSGFSDRVKHLLGERGLKGTSLLLEITESALMADPDHARRILQSLAEVGIRFSIDDYGTGYSSLAYLRSLPIHSLKIDRTFISQMLDSEQDRIIVSSTVQLAHNLGLEVTAEGIENNAVLAELRVLGCDRGQGFFIARPLADSDIAEWVILHERLRSSFASRNRDASGPSAGLN